MEDKRKKGVVDWANDAYSLYQNARLISSATKSVGAVTRPFVAASLRILGPILGFVGFFLLVIIVLIILGKKGAASEINPSYTPPPTAIPIQEVMGMIKISGATDSELKTISDALSLAAAYQYYKGLFTNGGPVNVSFKGSLFWPLDSTNVVDGLVLDGNQIQIRSGISKLAYDFIHETGHIIAFRNPDLFNSYPYNMLELNDPRCYSQPGYLLSYPFAERGGGGDPRTESFAESVAQFVFYKDFPVIPADSTSSFIKDCPNTYGWFKNNVFLGVSQGPLP